MPNGNAPGVQVGNDTYFSEISIKIFWNGYFMPALKNDTQGTLVKKIRSKHQKEIIKKGKKTPEETLGKRF